jgi:hypothetical protein
MAVTSQIIIYSKLKIFSFIQRRLNSTAEIASFNDLNSKRWLFSTLLHHVVKIDCRFRCPDGGDSKHLWDVHQFLLEYTKKHVSEH